MAHVAHADVAARAGAVFNDDGAEHGRHGIGNGARGNVERTSRRVGNHNADGVAALTPERRGAGIHREIRGARECHRSDGTQYSATLHKGCSFFLMQKKSLI